MKILLPSLNRKDSTGGGSTFIRNFVKAVKLFGHECVESGEHDIFFIAGATLCDREQFNASKAIKILRVDNILEDSRNRNGGMPKMKEYAETSHVVYQSEWAKRLLTPYAGQGTVIHNGVDTDIFYPDHKNDSTKSGGNCLYIKHSRNETKRFDEVRFFWREYNLNPSKRSDTLVLVGTFADDIQKINHPFEFHNEEKFKYEGYIQDPKLLAKIINTCDFAFLPYFADACSNTVLEVQSCGVPVLYCPYGGTEEIVDYGKPIDWEKYDAEQMVDYLFNPTLSFDARTWRDTRGLMAMGEKYDALFRFLKEQQ